MGDTPAATLCTNFNGVDEIRPGNFVFYDLMQHSLGVCAIEDIAVKMVCPVIAKHVSRNEIVIFGGAVLRDFAIAMIWGVLIGTYSSVFVAVGLLSRFDIKRGDDDDDNGDDDTDDDEIRKEGNMATTIENSWRDDADINNNGDANKVNDNTK